MYRFALRPRWIAGHLLVASVAASCAGLGVWQLQRLEQRRDINALIGQRGRLPLQPLETLSGPPASLVHRRVVVTGRYDTSREVVLRGRSLNETPGHHLLTPLVRPDGSAVVVDRGWVPADMDEPPVSAASPPAGQVTVTGVLTPSQDKGVLGPRDPPTGTLRRTGRVDVARLARQMPYKLHPLYVRLGAQDPTQPGNRPAIPPSPPTDEGPHLSYAVQWFLFAAICLVVYMALLRKLALIPDKSDIPSV